MTKMLTFIFLGFTAVAAQAQTPLTAEEFEAYTTGKTLYFGRDGQDYGVERYFENRRVRWSFLDGKCQEGIWYEDQGDICFVYENQPDPQCWSFFRGPRGLTALYRSDELGTEIYEARQDDKPMVCLGPDVGA